ncbi:hypothetical protein TNCV_4254451 [Trichonephila clavipes]|nr:hypothetical protein TNCV_4254451 [Trichonephila clavipes]
MLIMMGIIALGHTRGTDQVQVGATCLSTLQPTNITLRFPCAWSPAKTSEMEELQLERRLQGCFEGLGLVTATGILGTRNPSVC